MHAVWHARRVPTFPLQELLYGAVCCKVTLESAVKQTNNGRQTIISLSCIRPDVAQGNSHLTTVHTCSCVHMEGSKLLDHKSPRPPPVPLSDTPRYSPRRNGSSPVHSIVCCLHSCSVLGLLTTWPAEVSRWTRWRWMTYLSFGDAVRKRVRRA